MYLYLTCLLKQGFLRWLLKIFFQEEPRTIKCSVSIPALKLAVGKGFYVKN
jgi:hypothetical protein